MPSCIVSILIEVVLVNRIGLGSQDDGRLVVDEEVVEVTIEVGDIISGCVRNKDIDMCSVLYLTVDIVIPLVGNLVLTEVEGSVRSDISLHLDVNDVILALLELEVDGLGLAFADLLRDDLAAEVARHDEDRVLEVDRAAMAVREPSVV